VLDRPNVAELRVRPRRKQIVFGSCLLSLLLGVGWILAREKVRAMDEQHPIKSLWTEICGHLGRSRSADRFRGARGFLLRRLGKFGSHRGNPA
jgi:hypothetical protein